MGLAHVTAVVATILFALTIVGGVAPRLVDMVGQWQAGLMLAGYRPPVPPPQSPHPA